MRLLKWKGVVMGFGVGVLFTITVLWGWCPPTSYQSSRGLGQWYSSRVQSSGRDEVVTAVGDQQQNSRRLPLMADEDASAAAEEEVDEQGDAGGRLPPLEVSEIDCVINRKSSVSCRRDETDVFVPFSFIHDYFEVFGRLSTNKDGEEVFEWSHSYSSPFVPQKPYDPLGAFINFHFSNVESRPRVKCISAMEGVPISIQWKSQGHFYPIQIAQFGLSHYSKHLEGPPAQRFFIDACKDVASKTTWRPLTTQSRFSKFFDPKLNCHRLKFSSGGAVGGNDEGGIVTKIPQSVSSDKLVLKMLLTLESPSTTTTPLERGQGERVEGVHSNLSGGSSGSDVVVVVATVRTGDKKTDVFYVHYVLSDKFVYVKDNRVFYGLGQRWKTAWLTRNLLVDLLKGIAKQKNKIKKINKSKVRLLRLEFRGNGVVSDVSLSTSEHLRHFYDAADWLVRHQDSRGGWPTPIGRKIVAGVIELAPNWYSAMAQGHAMSLLVRASHHSGDPKYVRSAVRATGIFSNVSEGGVRTYFPGGFAWYEEYPTTPSLFVLNGFMFSLLGLYDLTRFTTAGPNPSGRLFEEGMRSLRALLPLFDTGQGSFYDLRHFSAHVSPNVARWDYHTTHVAQLLTLASLTTPPEGGDPHTPPDDDFLKVTALRWKDYVDGKRAKHN